MKKIRILSAAVSCIAAVLIAAFPGSAYLDAVKSSAKGFVSEKSGWKHVIDTEYNGLISNAGMLEFVVTLKGDANKYEQELKDAENTQNDDSDALEFEDFEGSLSVGAVERVQFDFSSLSNSRGDASHAGVKQLGDNRYLFFADLSRRNLVSPYYGTTLNFEEWGNASKDYCLHIDEVYLYNKAGTVILYFDELGNAEYSHDPFPVDPYLSVKEETTAAAPEPEPEKNEVPEKNDAPEKQDEQASENEMRDFGSRDSSLVTVAIVAAAFIVVFGAAIAIYVIRRKR